MQPPLDQTFARRLPDEEFFRQLKDSLKPSTPDPPPGLSEGDKKIIEAIKGIDTRLGKWEREKELRREREEGERNGALRQAIGLGVVGGNSNRNGSAVVNGRDLSWLDREREDDRLRAMREEGFRYGRATAERRGRGNDAVLNVNVGSGNGTGYEMRNGHGYSYGYAAGLGDRAFDRRLAALEREPELERILLCEPRRVQLREQRPFYL